MIVCVRLILRLSHKFELISVYSTSKHEVRAVEWELIVQPVPMCVIEREMWRVSVKEVNLWWMRWQMLG